MRYPKKRSWREIRQRFLELVPVGGWFFLQEGAKALMGEFNLIRVQQGREIIFKALLKPKNAHFVLKRLFRQIVVRVK